MKRVPNPPDAAGKPVPKSRVSTLCENLGILATILMLMFLSILLAEILEKCTLRCEPLSPIW